MKKVLLSLLCLFPIFIFSQNGRQVVNFNSDWQFSNQEDFAGSQTIEPTNNDFSFTGWKSVTLPHTAKIEPLVVKEPWVGVSWYKKDFKADKEWKNKKVFVEFEAVMQKADIWLNGKYLLTHYGGYLPFTIDISNDILFDKTNRIVVKTDNTDNAEIPPGKPIDKLDFCYYSGIYRNVSIIVTNGLHITDAVEANLPASGGLRIWFPKVSAQSATIAVSTNIRNDSETQKKFSLTYKLFNKSGKLIETISSKEKSLEANKAADMLQNIEVTNPQLWHPDHPDLYTLEVTINENKKITDMVETKLGIRKFEILKDRFLLNDEPLLLVGTNRHQEYPYIGNALSDNAQYRDAVKIKEAGFNIVRLSHYPQSPAFMNACDELGILTIAAIPGWQFVGDETFMQRSYQNARDLIRRDRNHASVAMWELSLNESPMPENFMKQMVAIAGEESPESKLITCGWINKYYDVWIPARQHAKFPDYWKKYKGKTPLFTGEYGDWEYFAQDAGLNQAGYAGLKSDERTSRQLRGDGEQRLLQQASNFEEAHNDNLKNPHLGDANWLMFDYNRGYSPDIESSGIMDIFRLPKFAYYFYRSQNKPGNSTGKFDKGPTVKIASYWNEKTDFKNLKIFSNCDEVALYLNNKLLERKTYTKDNISEQLPYPPFVFNLQKYEPGELKAVGYIGEKAVTKDIVCTAGKPSFIKLTYDRSGKSLQADGSDVVFLYAEICDSKGNQVVNPDIPIQFTLKGNGELVGQNPIISEAGIATILLKAGKISGKINLEATAEGLTSAKITITSIK
jgi:beta-galactosidase